MSTSAIGRRIRARRDEMGFTQAELAERAGLGRSSIAQYERGRTRPRAGELEALARTMGLSVDELLTGRKASGISGGPEQLHLEPEQEILGVLLSHPVFTGKVRKTFHEFLMALEKELMAPMEKRSAASSLKFAEPASQFNQGHGNIEAFMDHLKELGKVVVSPKESALKSTALLTLKSSPKGTPYKANQVLFLEEAPSVDDLGAEDWILVTLRGKTHFARPNPKEGIQGYINPDGMALSSKCQVIGRVVEAYTPR